MTGRVRMLVSTFASAGAKNLAKSLDVLRLHLHKTEFVPKKGDLIINWGCIRRPDPWQWNEQYFTWLNAPLAVAQSANRLASLPKMKEAGVNVPAFTTKLAEANQWLTDGAGVIARAKIHSHSGEGLTYVAPGGVLPTDSALYTKYQPKKHEYRVHVFQNEVLFIQEKRRRKGVPHNNQIRSFDNGWVFCLENVQAPTSVTEGAVAATAALGLDFAAVDVGWTEKTGMATVYECNTAPGLSPGSVAKYTTAIELALKAGEPVQTMGKK